MPVLVKEDLKPVLEEIHRRLASLQDLPLIKLQAVLRGGCHRSRQKKTKKRGKSRGGGSRGSVVSPSKVVPFDDDDSMIYTDGGSSVCDTSICDGEGDSIRDGGSVCDEVLGEGYGDNMSVDSATTMTTTTISVASPLSSPFR